MVDLGVGEVENVVVVVESSVLPEVESSEVVTHEQWVVECCDGQEIGFEIGRFLLKVQNVWECSS